MKPCPLPIRFCLLLLANAAAILALDYFILGPGSFFLLEALNPRIASTIYLLISAVLAGIEEYLWGKLRGEF